MSKRTLARLGDRISYNVMGKRRIGKVIRRQGDYLSIRLDEPRTLADWERLYPAYSDPMEDNVYLHSDYIIEEYAK